MGADPRARARASRSSSGAGSTASRSSDPFFVQTVERALPDAVQPALPAGDADRRARRARAGARAERLRAPRLALRLDARLADARRGAAPPRALGAASRRPGILRADARRRRTRSAGCARIVSALGRPRARRRDALRPEARRLEHVQPRHRCAPRSRTCRGSSSSASRSQVLASHLRQRGAHMVPGALDPALFGFDPARSSGSRPRSTAPASSPRSTARRSSTATSERCSSTTASCRGRRRPDPRPPSGSTATTTSSAR